MGASTSRQIVGEAHAAAKQYDQIHGEQYDGVLNWGPDKLFARRVEKGDTLWHLSREYLGDGNKWPYLQAACDLDADPYHLIPGRPLTSQCINRAREESKHMHHGYVNPSRNPLHRVGSYHPVEHAVEHAVDHAVEHGVHNVERGVKNVERDVHNVERDVHNVERGVHNVERNVHGVERDVKNIARNVAYDAAKHAAHQVEQALFEQGRQYIGGLARPHETVKVSVSN